MDRTIESNVTVVLAGPSLTIDNAHELIRLIRNVPVDSPPNIIVNLNNTRVMDSTGVGMLVSSMRYLRQVHGSFAVAGLAPELRHMFQLMNLNSVLNVFDSVESASLDLGRKRSGTP
ncbi:MAG: STAS domain-containing protein [Bacteroidota bacterium]